VRDEHVVVGQAVNEEEGAPLRWLYPFRIIQKRTALVGVAGVIGVTEVSLGVVRVVQPPVGDGRARHGGVEDVGAAQHGERG
jgi:hypothetical protein